jgi:hypothetical protein
MLAIPKSDRVGVEKLLSSVLSAFNEQHSQYLASKALFDKRAQASERSKAGEVKILTAMIEVHMHLVRLVRTLVELRSAFESGVVAGSLNEKPAALGGLQVLEEENRGALNELMGL